MTHRFDHAITPASTELRLLGPGGPVPIERWAIEAPPALRLGVDLAERLRAADMAFDHAATLRIEHSAIAGLSAREATSLGLPPLTDAMAAVSTRGLIIRPDFTAELRWQRRTGQPIAGAERIGAWLRIGTEWRRLPDVLFALAEAIERLRAVPRDDQAGRFAALAALRDTLP